MATQVTSPSIAPLIAVTIVTSIYLIPVGEALASELSAQLAIPPATAGADRPHDSVLQSADAVAKERWARSQDDYVLGDGGQIVPYEMVPTPDGATAPSAYRIDELHNHFNGSISPAVSECGPSPATPAEITRLVVEAAQRYKVDVGFAVAVATAESQLDRLRNSPKGARGPMQLMPGTAERFGVSDICDPDANIDGGVRYLRELTDEFRNPLLVAAAYNAGEGRVREHGGIPPFKETLGYVAKVLNIQMGIEGSGPTASERHDTAKYPQRPSHLSGVITSRDRRQWVGGVMHF